MELDVLLDATPPQKTPVHAGDLVASRHGAHLGAVVEADEVLEVVGAIARVCNAVASAERGADVVARGYAGLLDELGKVASEPIDAVPRPGVVGVAVSALVDGDHPELFVQRAGDVVPVVGVAALSMREKQVTVRRPFPVEVVDVESVDLNVVIGGCDVGHGVLLSGMLRGSRESPVRYSRDMLHMDY